MECYLKVKDDSDGALLEKCWMKVTRCRWSCCRLDGVLLRGRHARFRRLHSNRQSGNRHFFMEILFQAADLSIKFLSRDQAVEVVRVVAPQLAGRRKHGDVSDCTHTHTAHSSAESELTCPRLLTST